MHLKESINMVNKLSALKLVRSCVQYFFILTDTFTKHEANSQLLPIKTNHHTPKRVC